MKVTGCGEEQMRFQSHDLLSEDQVKTPVHISLNFTLPLGRMVSIHIQESYAYQQRPPKHLDECIQ